MLCCHNADTEKNEREKKMQRRNLRPQIASEYV